MARPRQRLRPRYGRVAALASSVVVTVVAVLGGIGAIPVDPSRSVAAVGVIEPVADRVAVAPARVPTTGPGTPVGSFPGVAPGRSPDERALETELTLPAGGHGRRAVFSESRQRVWLVDRQDRVLHTYQVSGSVHDNLEPGTYRVWSRSMDAWGVQDSGTMHYFVRFARGDTGAAIGFHDIPVDGGAPVQSLDQLGTPQSHGCIRQRRSDAKRMWVFAPLGTTVVVTA